MRVSSNFGNITRDVELVVGSQYLVSPLNPQKLKHRGRICVLVGFAPSSSADKDMSKGTSADVRFLDNNRRGRVDLSDLVPAPSE